MTPTPADKEPTPDGPTQKSRRSKGWLLVVGLLILLGMLGYLINQRQASKGTNSDIESQTRESPPTPAVPETQTDTTQQSPKPRASVGAKRSPTEPSQVVYMVTHKHRLRDCHGTLTFTRDRLRFESDEPQDSFAVARDDVTVEGDAVRIHDKTWRFVFNDAVRAESIFRDWKSGSLRLVSRP